MPDPRRYGPTALSKRQARIHFALVALVGVMALLVRSWAVGAALLLLGLALSRAFRFGVRLNDEDGQVKVIAAHRLGWTRTVVAARVGLRQTIGIHEVLYAPIVFPQTGSSLTLWSLAEKSEAAASRWCDQLIGQTQAEADPRRHF